MENVVYFFHSLLTQSQNKDAHLAPFSEKVDLPKVEVVSEDNTPLSLCQRYDLVIW